MADNDDALFLQVKEARTSVLEPYASKSVYPNRGQRIVAGRTEVDAIGRRYFSGVDCRS